MISVVIPLYNKEQSVSTTLQSVLNQTFQDFEIVVINDGSTDESVTRISQFSDNRIRLFNKVNGGVSSARNRGIKEARYDYIAFLDADDTWDSIYLEEQWKMIQDFPEASMWGCGFYKKTASEREPSTTSLYRGLIANYWTSQPVPYWISAIVVSKNIFSMIDAFDECIKFGEDVDVIYHIILNFQVAYNSALLACYCQDSENRAMMSKITMSVFLPFYIEKYKIYREKNSDFQVFFDRTILGWIYPYFLEDTKNKDIQKILKQVNFSTLSISYWLRFRIPWLYKFLRN